MKKIFKLFIPIIIAVILTLVGCDGGGRNPITHKKEPIETVATEAPTESNIDETQAEQYIESKQKMYEDMFNDTFTMDSNSNNIIATITKQDSNVIEVENTASGDSKNVIYLENGTKYTVYNIGEDSYLEIHVPEYKDSEGEIKGAEDLYYKITNNKISSDALLSEDANIKNLSDISESLQLSTENISSVKYLGDQTVHGVDCSAVEIKSRVKKDEETINNKTIFYFNDWNVMFGIKFSTSTNTIDCYFPDSLKIELPKDVEFKEVEDSVINEKISSIKPANSLNSKN